MAFTRIHSIKTTLSKALDYIENPEKTEGQLLVSGYNVDPLMASVDFSITARLAREDKGDYTKTGGAENLAYHMIQSFAPGDDITSEEAHELGKRWADELLGGKYEYVIATHVDKGHIHNHVIFNAVSFYDHRHFNNYRVAGKLRQVSDRPCEETGLFVIREPQGRGMSHYEWAKARAGQSWKAQIKYCIDRAVKLAEDYAQFQRILYEYGIEMLPGKRLTFHVIGIESDNGRAGKVRGDRIGPGYTTEGIQARISAAVQQREAARQAAQQRPVPERYDERLSWEARRAALASTRELANALLTIRREDIRQDSDFDVRAEIINEQAAQLRHELHSTEDTTQQYRQAAKYLVTYHQLLPVKLELDRQPRFMKKAFAARHSTELQEFGRSTDMLRKLGVNTNVDPDKVLELIRDRDHHAQVVGDKLKEATDRYTAIRQAQALVEQIRRGSDARQIQQPQKHPQAGR